MDIVFSEAGLNEVAKRSDAALLSSSRLAFELLLSQDLYSGSLEERFADWYESEFIPMLKRAGQQGRHILHWISQDHNAVDAHLAAVITGFLICQVTGASHVPLNNFMALAVVIIRHTNKKKAGKAE